MPSLSESIALTSKLVGKNESITTTNTAHMKSTPYALASAMSSVVKPKADRTAGEWLAYSHGYHSTMAAHHKSSGNDKKAAFHGRTAKSYAKKFANHEPGNNPVEKTTGHKDGVAKAKQMIKDNYPATAESIDLVTKMVGKPVRESLTDAEYSAAQKKNATHKPADHARDIRAAAKSSSGDDATHLHAIADMVAKGDKVGAKRYADTRDTEVREKIPHHTWLHMGGELSKRKG